MFFAIEAWRRRRAARAYGRNLGRWLKQAYGASKTYTAPQIERGIKELKLNPRYAVFGHAIFLEKEKFDLVASRLPMFIDYEKARTLAMQQLLSATNSRATEPFRDNLDNLAVASLRSSVLQGMGAGTSHADTTES
ncbi:MAG: DUF6559 family protein [Dongiaceae bacterium]